MTDIIACFIHDKPWLIHDQSMKLHGKMESLQLTVDNLSLSQVTVQNTRKQNTRGYNPRGQNTIKSKYQIPTKYQIEGLTRESNSSARQNYTIERS